MIIDRIFPTTIMVFDDVLEEEYIKSMGNDILSFKGYDAKWQSTYRPEALSNKALELSKKYIDEL